MDKLKTLKDIVNFDCADCGYDFNNLRKEAIKWVKKLELGNAKMKEITINGVTFTEDKWERMELSSIQEWIKHFFNITNEELKDE